MTERYPTEILGKDNDDGTMPNNVQTLADAVVGHRIVSVETDAVDWPAGALITLDNGKRVRLEGTFDCCASTELESFMLQPERVDHIITGIGTTDGYTTWHIYADLGDVLELKVGWDPGNPFFYAYGFDIRVTDIET